ncbi:hypothetical protein HYU16_00805 [Candidatus Woesearchaeota archaeon]|nr:hypothetical protein [Candidatus Woesearchaeota archaeon]
MTESLNDGRTWLTAHASKGNMPIPINREKNIFSSISKLAFFRISKGGMTNKTAIARIVRKPAMPKRANAATAMAARAKSHATPC